MSGSHLGAGGPLAVHVPGFRAALAERCYSERAARTHVELLRHLGNWLQDEDLSLPELTADRLAEFGRDAVRRLVERHARAAAERCPSLRAKQVSPHVLRHSCVISPASTM